MDGQMLLKFGAAFVFVICLMFGLSWALKKFGLAGVVTSPLSRKRLKIIEVLPLDPRRRLVLISRDDKEHLLVLGPGGETLVESGITTASPSPVEKG